MGLSAINYQSTIWNTTPGALSSCGLCERAIKMDQANTVKAQIGLTEFTGMNLITNAYNGLDTPNPVVRVPTLVNLTEGPTGTYCYDHTLSTPYLGSYTLDLDQRSLSIGDIALNDYLKVTFNYTSNVTFTFVLKLIENDGSTVIQTLTSELSAATSSQEITRYFRVTTASATGYQLVLEFYASQTRDAEFCFDTIDLVNMSIVNAFSFIDCNGDSSSLSATLEYFEDMMLLTITPPTDTTGYIRLFDGINFSENVSIEERSKLYSNNITFFDPDTTDSCMIPGLYVQWTESCFLENQETQYTSIDYEFYLEGFTQRIPLVTKERVMITDANTGRDKMVYNHSYAPEQITVSTYGIAIHEVMERAVESSYFAVNGQEYRLNEGNTYTIAPISNGRYTARVDMTKIGSERIRSLCCCPVSNVTLGCGDIVITDICSLFLGNRIIRYEIVNPGTGTQIDLQFENLEAISTDTPCTVSANTTFDIINAATIGNNAILMTGGDFNDIFTDNYCDVTNIRYSVRIRLNCGEGEEGAWSEAYVLVPDNIQICSS